MQPTIDTCDLLSALEGEGLGGGIQTVDGAAKGNQRRCSKSPRLPTKFLKTLALPQPWCGSSMVRD